MILNVFIFLGTLLGVTRACRFSSPYVPVLVFIQDQAGVVSREIHLPLYGNSTDCLYPSRADPILPGKSLS